MFQSITSLSLSDAIASRLKDNGFFYVEDIKDVSASKTTCSDAIEEAQKFCKVPQSVSALDVLQEELQREKITTLSQELDNILDGGFQCNTVMELCGAPGSGKTQICLQACINVQLSKAHNGLGGEALYIDTRSGMMTLRLKEMAMGSRAYFEEQNFDVDKILDRIIIYSPQSYNEMITLLYNIKYLTEHRQIRLIIVDSLSFLRYSVENALHRTQICFKILDGLHKLSLRCNLSVVVTNELINQVTSKGEIDLAPAGGPLCAHRVHKRLMLRRLNNNQFVASVIKAPTVPKVSAKFQVTVNGVRDIIN